MQSSKEKASFTEQYFDYSNGREDAPTLTVMVGPAGSGKSTIAKSVVNWAAGKTVRLNRDTIRGMLYADSPWNHYEGGRGPQVGGRGHPHVPGHGS